MSDRLGGLTHLPVRGTKRAPTIDFSSLSNLAGCQWRWYARYVRGLPEKPSTALQLGTLMHELCGLWWQGDDWQPHLVARIKEWQAENPDAEFVPEWLDKAAWLMGRYEEHYAAERDSVKVIATELYFKVRLPHRYGYLVGQIDNLWEIDGHIWVVERKTGSDFSKLDQHERSHQTTFYYWAAQQLGYEPWGIVLDFIRTYRWKRDPHPPADSFERRWLDRNDEHLANAILEAGKGLTLAKMLINGQLEPLRNFDQHCQWCDASNQCAAELGFNDLVVPDSFAFEE
jgi:hypothetical protein